MIYNDNIVAIMKKLYDEKYLNEKTMFKAYYMFLKTSLTESELKEYAENDYNWGDVDEWMALKKIFGDIGYDTAMTITKALYEDSQAFNVMDSNFFEEDVKMDEYEEAHIDIQAEFLWGKLTVKINL